MLQIQNLIKYYGTFKAVDGLSLNIEAGNIFGFVGPNGAGKTTTMKIIAGLLSATSGTVIVNDVDVSHNQKSLKEKIGYMPDFFGIYDNLKVAEYMDFYAGTYYIPYGERKELIDNLLDIVNLSDKYNTYVDSLSRGMKQRLCLARSLIHDPDVLILDEPASGLDPRARVEMKEILKQLKSLGKTIIISSHILTELAEICTVIGIIDKGKMVTQGTIADITKQLTKRRRITIKQLDKTKELIVLLSEQPLVSNITELTEELEFDFSGTNLELSELVKCVSSNIPIIAFSEKEGNLEDIFMKLTAS